MPGRLNVGNRDILEREPLALMWSREAYTVVTQPVLHTHIGHGVKGLLNGLSAFRWRALWTVPAVYLSGQLDSRGHSSDAIKADT